MIKGILTYIIGRGRPGGGGTGTGEANVGNNVGTGLEVYQGKTGVTLNFRTLSPDATDFDSAQNADDISIELSETGVTPGTYNNANVTVDIKGRVTNISAGASGIGDIWNLLAENMGQVNSTIGPFTRHTINQNNPSGLALTTSGDVYPNGLLAPVLMHEQYEIQKIKVVVAQAAVATAGPVGANPTFRLDFYHVNIGNRTLIQTVRIPCNSGQAYIGVNNTLATGANFIYFEILKAAIIPAIQPPKGYLLGWEFVNESSNDAISAFTRAMSVVQLKQIA
jgi:hypothetical protein